MKGITGKRAARGSKPRVGARRARPRRLMLLVATRKGAWLFHGDAARKTWRVDGPHFLGHIVNHLVLDPRDGRTLLAAAKTGHLGPTIFRSTDLGRTWKEAARPPAFPKAPDGENGRAVDHTFWLTPAHASEPGRLVRGHLAAGPLPLRGRRRHLGAVLRPQRRPAVPRVDGHRAGRHARRAEAALDHRRPARPGAPLPRRCRAAACTSRATAGRPWRPLVQGMEVVEGFDAANLTFHDPHCVRLCPSNPDRLYQQNHCGIYRLDRPGDTVGAHRQEHAEAASATSASRSSCTRATPTRAWVFPMDGTTVWPRTSPDGEPAVYVTRNAGKTWQRLDAGLPRQPGVVDGEAPGDDGGRAGPGGPVLRHDQRRALDEPRRGRRWSCHRAAPARDLRGRGGRAGVGASVMKVLIPSPLHSYTGRK